MTTCAQKGKAVAKRKAPQASAQAADKSGANLKTKMGKGNKNAAEGGKTPGKKTKKSTASKK